MSGVQRRFVRSAARRLARARRMRQGYCHFNCQREFIWIWINVDISLPTVWEKAKREWALGYQHAVLIHENCAKAKSELNRKTEVQSVILLNVNPIDFPLIQTL